MAIELGEKGRAMAIELGERHSDGRPRRKKG